MNDPSKIVFNCSHCPKQFSISAQFAGKRAKCTACGNTFSVPEASPAVDGLFADLGSFPIATAVPAPVSAYQCSQCQAAMAPGAVLCIKCGFDTRTGRQLEVAATEDALDFPQPNGTRIASAVVAAILIVVILDQVVLKLVEQFDASLLLPMFAYMVFVCLALLLAWGYNLRFEVIRQPNKPALLVRTFRLGPFRIVKKWDLSQYDAVWFVQRPWSSFQQSMALLRAVGSLGIHAIIRKLLGAPEQLIYRAELRTEAGKKVVLYRGNETVKQYVNHIVRLIRDAAKLPLKNDIEMLR